MFELGTSTFTNNTGVTWTLSPPWNVPMFVNFGPYVTVGTISKLSGTDITHMYIVLIFTQWSVPIWVILRYYSVCRQGWVPELQRRRNGGVKSLCLHRLNFTFKSLLIRFPLFVCRSKHFMWRDPQTSLLLLPAAPPESRCPPASINFSTRLPFPASGWVSEFSLVSAN